MCGVVRKLPSFSHRLPTFQLTVVAKNGLSRERCSSAMKVLLLLTLETLSVVSEIILVKHEDEITPEEK